MVPNSRLYPPQMSATPDQPQRPRVNVRRPDVMELVAAEVAVHFHSTIVEKLRDHGGKITVGNTTLLLAEQFGFCYGVERAIDLAYASRQVFPDNRIFLIGEIIHNPGGQPPTPRDGHRFAAMAGNGRQLRRSNGRTTW